MENSMESPQKIKNTVTYNRATPLLGIYLKLLKTFIRKDMRTPMFTATLLVVAKT